MTTQPDPPDSSEELNSPLRATRSNLGGWSPDSFDMEFMPEGPEVDLYDDPDKQFFDLH